MSTIVCSRYYYTTFIQREELELILVVPIWNIFVEGVVNMVIENSAGDERIMRFEIDYLKRFYVPLHFTESSFARSGVQMTNDQILEACKQLNKHCKQF